MRPIEIKSSILILERFLKSKLVTLFTSEIMQESNYLLLSIDITEVIEKDGLIVVKGKHFYNHGQLFDARMECFESLWLLGDGEPKIVKVLNELFPGLYTQVFPKI